MEEKIYYCLYADASQKKLHAFAYSKEQLKEVSLKYTEGVWFEYDVEHSEGKTDKLYN